MTYSEFAGRLNQALERYRQGGYNVNRESGWQVRGHGPMGDVVGIICHHDVSPGQLGTRAPAPSCATAAPVSWPLANLGLWRDGTANAVAAGLAYHGGTGSWSGRYGKSRFIGIEAANTGAGELRNSGRAGKVTRLKVDGDAGPQTMKALRDAARPVVGWVAKDEIPAEVVSALAMDVALLRGRAHSFKAGVGGHVAR